MSTFGSTPAPLAPMRQCPREESGLSSSDARRTLSALTVLTAGVSLHSVLVEDARIILMIALTGGVE